MILEDQVKNKAVMSSGIETTEFKIKASAKAFQILSDGLYSNKIKAILRELGCNAYDSHVAAGKKDVPFEVHLPTIYEPHFSVRDFGTGLSEEQVVSIFTTYFESTKSNSNDFVGALGLGSKSPFSYTDNFSITAIKDGHRNVFSAYITDDGIPAVAKLFSDITDEANGVEIKFAVKSDRDFNTFVNEAQEVYSWFDVKPTFNFAVNFRSDYKQCIDLEIAPKVVSLSYTTTAGILMGNIWYPIYSSDIPPGVINALGKNQEYAKRLLSYLDRNLLMLAEIGEVSFSASRESLSMDKKTVQFILDRLQEVEENIMTHFNKEIAPYEANPFDLIKQINSLSNKRIYGPLTCRLYCEQNKDKLIFPYEGFYSRSVTVRNITYKREDVASDNVRLEIYAQGRHSLKRVFDSANTSAHWFDIGAHNKPIVIDAKDKRLTLSDVNQNFSCTSKVFVFSRIDKKNDQYDFSSVIDNTLLKYAATKKMSDLHFERKERVGYEPDSFFTYSARTQTWHPMSEEELSKITDGVYVNIKRKTPTDYLAALDTLVAVFDTFFTGKLIFVRSHGKEFLKQHGGFKELRAAVQEKINELDDKELSNCISNPYPGFNFDTLKDTGLSPETQYYKFFEEFYASPYHGVASTLRQKFQAASLISVDVSAKTKIMQEAEEKKEKFLRVYPLLNRVYNATYKEIVEYIHLIDNIKPEN